MSRTVKCTAKGCPGFVTIETDGKGGTRDRCACCEKRAEWKAEHCPDMLKLTCGICGGKFFQSPQGAAAKHCTACKNVLAIKQRREQRQRFIDQGRQAAPLRSA